MYGVNYAWSNFAGDFGGISAYNQGGLSQNERTVSDELADMAANGASVIRWWVWPDFRGDGVTFSGNNATGLGSSVVTDLNTALELAVQHDLYLMLTLFSFDGFRGGSETGPNMEAIIANSGSLGALVENAVRPFARAAEASPNRDRLIAWDVINEPEWAMRGDSPYGDDAYTPNDELSTVDHATMETFVSEVIAGLRAESGALVSVGGSAMKWKRAWSNVDIDFYQFHLYDWVDQSWPYDSSPAAFGVTDKPIVMGEFPMNGLSRADYSTLLSSWYSNGYAGALGWAVTDRNFDWSGSKSDVRAFADEHSCETRY
jgi:hypothetical protein